ncbi:MAG TPA: peptide chain release factor-like protein [Myxococcota bacterium]|nr:peptide chain release factor-like protein [Myxococcota bacterium]
MHPASLPIPKLLRDVEFRTTRGPGPGGQHRNKSDTMVRLTHRPTGIHAQAGERRSLDLNREIAVHRLRVNLALQHRRPITERLAAGSETTSAPAGGPALYEPSELWRSRIRGSRLVVSARHEDFPALLAESLDVLAWLGDDVPKAARSLGVSGSQLGRFLALEPAALAELNERRRRAGKHAYR